MKWNLWPWKMGVDAKLVVFQNELAKSLWKYDFCNVFYVDLGVYKNLLKGLNSAVLPDHIQACRPIFFKGLDT